MRISDWSSDVCSSDLKTATRWSSSFGKTTHPGKPVAKGPPWRSGGHERLGPGHPLPVDRNQRRCRVGSSRQSGRIREIGRASCRERVCQYVSISVVAVSLKKKKKTKQ